MEDFFAEKAKEFEEDVSARLDYYVSLYKEKFGKCIDTDKARFLCPEYADNCSNRPLLAPLIHESCSKIAKAVWKALLMESSEESGVVIFLAGGPGSGKSVVTESEKFKEVFENAIVVYDSTFSTFNSANRKIEEALNAKKEIDVYYIYRNAKDAAYSVVMRALNNGRTVPIQKISELHWGALATIIQLCQTYEKSDDVTIHLFDNSGDIDSFNWFESYEDFQKVFYSNIIEVEQLVQEGVKSAYDDTMSREGSFPERIYQGIFGKENAF